jgi:hypothetical protein
MIIQAPRKIHSFFYPLFPGFRPNIPLKAGKAEEKAVELTGGLGRVTVTVLASNISTIPSILEEK